MYQAMLPLLAFLAVVCGVLGLYSLLSDFWLRDRTHLDRRLDDSFRDAQRERARQSILFKDAKTFTGGPDETALASGRSWRDRLATLLEQAEVELTPGVLVMISAGVSMLLGLAAGLLRESVAVGALTGVAGAAVPFVYVVRKRNARRQALHAQLPDAFDLMAQSLRAGQTMSQAMQNVADTLPKPIAAEFLYCYEQQNLGLPPETALRDMARRTSLVEMDIFVLAMVVQRQAGGNLAELLGNLAHLVRQRYRLRSVIQTLTAEGRLQAGVLMALPPAVLAAMFFLNRSYAQALLDRPTLLVGMLVSELIGAIWIRRIVNFDH
jgi:tight adherence protein B